MPNDNDDFFPTIGLDIQARMIHSAEGWRYKVQMHALGPDDVMNFESQFFSSKRKCAYALMGEWKSRLSKLWRDYNSDDDLKAPENEIKPPECTVAPVEQRPDGGGE